VLNLFEQFFCIYFWFCHYFNSTNTVFFRGAWGSQDTNCDSVNGGLAVFPGTPCLVNTVREPRNLAFNWRWTPTARITNEFVAGHNQYSFLFIQPSSLEKVSLNSAPVDVAAQYQFGNYQIGNVRGPSVFNTDFSAAKRTPIGRTTAEIRIDVFNLFNRDHFANPATTFGNATFGTISNTRLTPREGQLGFRLLF